jgi:curli biogenesis system outer membrane secretion channel CsgG
MNYRVIILITIIFFSCGSGHVWVGKTPGQFHGTKLAIIGFDIRDIQSGKNVDEVSMEFSDALSPYFMQAGFKVIERNKLSIVMKEMELQQSGIVQAEDAVKLGKIAGIRYIVYGTGTVKYAGSRKDLFLHSITVKVIDVENGENVINANWSGAGVRPHGVAERIGEDLVKEFNKKK